MEWNTKTHKWKDHIRRIQGMYLSVGWPVWLLKLVLDVICTIIPGSLYILNFSVELL